ncbi:MAG: hypothetical protein LKE20_00165 [Limosilactobacillus oris]|jgi:hypothetical protein|uniref:hypothetical protein n=1 Tax=Limosilactobacillus oris TaxID=1632 RepID=UPI00242D7BCA|nr:hypothetical protein [Limosilactobacillus oris]MCH3910543.1 hypothetical protein [Limosilactobacillus oris]MCH3937795.1 hypothetical protein [Limosilactobacillus oris]MCI1980054.1 hypothetical protein [Limosilactobacillus oris]
MNEELKKMFKVGFGVLALLLVIINFIAWLSHNQALGATYSSQCLAVNRLRSPRVGRPSEHGHYPRLARHQRVKLMVVKKKKRLYVLSNHHVLYIINAKTNLAPTTTQINGARGTSIFTQNNNVQQVGANWLSLSQADAFIEAPTYINNHRVRGNWLYSRYHCTNTIDVSKPDARWLQSLPNNTRLVIKQGY